MYTYMTKVPDPKEMPKSFYQLLYNSSIPLLSDGQTAQDFLTLRDSNLITNLSNSNNVNRLWMDSILKYWLYNNGWENLWSMAKPNLDNGAYIKCHWFPEAFLDHILDKLSLTEGPVLKNCLDRDRFSLFYTTKPQQDYTGFGSQAGMSLYSKVLLLLYGEYTLVENKDTTLFSEMYVWLSIDRNYLMEVLNVKLSALVESGIYNFQNHYLILKSQLEALNEFLKESKTNSSWSRFSLVTKLVSNQNSMGASFKTEDLEYFGDSKRNAYISATLGDLKVAWIIYLICTTISVMQFTINWLISLVK